MAKLKISKERKALIESITDEELQNKIWSMATERGVEAIMAIPGVESLVLDALNNDAIEAIVQAIEAKSAPMIPEAKLPTSKA